MQKYGDMMNEIDCKTNEEYKLVKKTHLETLKTELIYCIKSKIINIDRIINLSGLQSKMVNFMLWH